WPFKAAGKLTRDWAHLNFCTPQCSHSGNLCLPMTLSMMIFNGHGAANVATVSKIIATNTIASQPRQGRTNSKTGRALVLQEQGVLSVTGLSLVLESS